jgi:hypothetical protein
MNVLLNGWMEGMNGWLDGRMDNLMNDVNEWKVGWMNGWI